MTIHFMHFLIYDQIGADAPTIEQTKQRLCYLYCDVKRSVYLNVMIWGSRRNGLVYMLKFIGHMFTCTR